MEKKIVVIGGGFAGCAAALEASKSGHRVTLLERADMLMGLGLVGGFMDNNGRYTAAQEIIALGGGELNKAIETITRHKKVEQPGHNHGTYYDATEIEPLFHSILEKAGVEIKVKARVVDVNSSDGLIRSVKTADGEVITGDSFVDATGGTGSQGNCTKYGNGCVMCILRCPTFGPRVSVAAKAGVKERMVQKEDGTFGAMSGACTLSKHSVDPGLVREVEQTGKLVVPLPKNLVKYEKLKMKACQQYTQVEFAENIVVADNGWFKIVVPFFPLEELRQIPGFAKARYEDPLSGGIGNSIRYLAVAPVEPTLQVKGIRNLFAGGEKSGLFVGHQEAMVTGVLAGYNAVRYIQDMEPVTMPATTALGDFLTYSLEQMEQPGGMRKRFTFSGSIYFEHMKERGLYTTDVSAIQKRVEDAGLTGIFNKFN